MTSNGNRRIGLDFDDLFVDTNGYLVSTYGTGFMTDGYLDSDPDIREIVGGALVKIFNKDHDDIPAVDGAIEGGQRLAKETDDEYVLVTGRPAANEGVTRRWFKNNIGVLVTDIYFSDRFNPGLPTKAEICEEQEIDLLVDDMVCDKLPDRTQQIVFGNFPWNKDPLPERTIRLITFRGVVDYLINGPNADQLSQAGLSDSSPNTER